MTASTHTRLLRGQAKVEDDGEPFEQIMKRLTATLADQFVESAKLEKLIRKSLDSLTARWR